MLHAPFKLVISVPSLPLISLLMALAILRPTSIILSQTTPQAPDLSPNKPPFPTPDVRYLDNGTIRLGIDLNLGGAITFFSRRGGENVINNYDLGRQVQLSFYSGPVPFVVGEKRPAAHWEQLGWNPIQAGDDYHHGSKVVDFSNEGQKMHVKCVPMQWPMNDVPGDCTFETWLELDGAVVKGKARLNNARSDLTQYPARQQELPAVYANAPFHRVVSYVGARPFEQAPVSDIPKSQTPHPWSFWPATEGWSALMRDDGQALGLLVPGHIDFTGGFVGKPGPNDTRSTSTGYLAGQAQEILDHHIVYDYRFELMLGTVEEIRARAATLRPQGLPSWTFTNNRQSWHYVNAQDEGWPIKGELYVKLDKQHPLLVSPYAFWQAEEAPVLVIEAAFHTHQNKARVFWWRHGLESFGPTDHFDFPVQTDGEFHRYEIRLADAPNYRGAMLRLRLDPQPDAAAEWDWVKIRSVVLRGK